MTQSVTTTAPVHTYATRIRQNITIKPSTRLRHSPEPHRKLRPAPAPAPGACETGLRADCPGPAETSFPSPHVVLHPEDASSRVFHSIARALLSVDNRAVTIKDLAEMCVAQGLACQNVSAASQAITTYIRSHLHRCDVQQDQPLLLRHVLSGTPSDDLLLPALHSKSGGAHQNIHADPNTPLRSTNFRKGTMIWYLSRVTGAPCPFARAGIRLCDHVDVSATLKDKDLPKRNRDTRSSAAIAASEQCGQKRKRRSTRSCVRAAMSADEHSDPSETEAAPPPKVKLTLRLKPLAKCISFVTPPSLPSLHPAPSANVIDLSLSSDDEHDNEMPIDSSDDDSSDDSRSEAEDSRPSQDADDEEWSMHSYPRRSISIPPYSPSSSHPSFSPASSFTRFRRSTSVPYSLASPPPDSEEDDDNTFSIFGGSRNTSSSYVNSSFDEEEDNYVYPSSDFDSGFEDNIDNDAETSFESPSPRSPFSAPPLLLPSIVKQEPRDVQGILDAWDDIGIRAPSTVEEVKATQVIGEAAAHMLIMDVGRIHEDNTVKFEPQDSGTDWDSERYRFSSSPLDHTVIKREVDSPDLDLNAPLMSFTAWRNGTDLLLSPTSATSAIANPFDLRDPFTTFDYDELSSPVSRRASESIWMEDDTGEYATLRPRAKTVASVGGVFKVEDVKENEALTSLIAALKMTSQPSVLSPDEVKPQVKMEDASFLPLPVCVSPNDIRLNCASQGSVSGKDVVVVTTCQPCVPEIFATDVEGISVYRTTIGEYTVLRRIDTDFVNLTPISAYSHGPQPVLSTIASAIVISKGSPLIQGTWVPLDVAQAYVCDHPVASVSPPTTPTRTSSSSSSLSQSGLLDVFLGDNLYQQFPDAIREFVKHSRKTRPPGFGKGFVSMIQAREVATQFNVALEEKPLPTLDTVLDEQKPRAVIRYDEPLSATEQEMFHALCVNLEWEKDPVETSSDLLMTSIQPPPEPERPKDVDTRPLRRSKRVAAIASRTRSRRRESRNLS
ncbi:uncharacterized protein BT62DRAFT_22170 [Guyanagaster necrorhizus]|uniref:GDS1 winged helix domain-containing protein n=1 Tax=Guyanagaster necrorhizus TaxID=856835 RepID=A0A9P7W3G6_9AGAR|nr:uncharacterized protein BT62DRAFT_22170 [Guyanagaster necrorhizus MCA 3950]KAG7452716.1 hypothetical protein BT62DRAFT_22170 [Guyanagaster necrorhizus MCA 3950]